MFSWREAGVGEEEDRRSLVKVPGGPASALRNAERENEGQVRSGLAAVWKKTKKEVDVARNEAGSRSFPRRTPSFSSTRCSSQQPCFFFSFRFDLFFVAMNDEECWLPLVSVYIYSWARAPWAMARPGGALVRNRSCCLGLCAEGPRAQNSIRDARLTTLYLAHANMSCWFLKINTAKHMHSLAKARPMHRCQRHMVCSTVCHTYWLDRIDQIRRMFGL